MINWEYEPYLVRLPVHEIISIRLNITLPDVPSIECACPRGTRMHVCAFPILCVLWRFDGTHMRTHIWDTWELSTQPSIISLHLFSGLLPLPTRMLKTPSPKLSPLPPPDTLAVPLKYPQLLPLMEK